MSETTQTGRVQELMQLDWENEVCYRFNKNSEKPRSNKYRSTVIYQIQKALYSTMM